MGKKRRDKPVCGQVLESGKCRGHGGELAPSCRALHTGSRAIDHIHFLTGAKVPSKSQAYRLNDLFLSRTCTILNSQNSLCGFFEKFTQTCGANKTTNKPTFGLRGLYITACFTFNSGTFRGHILQHAIVCRQGALLLIYLLSRAHTST